MFFIFLEYSKIHFLILTAILWAIWGNFGYFFEIFGTLSRQISSLGTKQSYKVKVLALKHPKKWSLVQLHGRWVRNERLGWACWHSRKTVHFYKKGVYKVAKRLENHAITFKSAFDKQTVVFYDKKPSILLVILNVNCNCI